MESMGMIEIDINILESQSTSENRYKYRFFFFIYGVHVMSHFLRYFGGSRMTHMLIFLSALSMPPLSAIDP